MLDGLKKKFGFGSLKAPETFPDPGQLAREEQIAELLDPKEETYGYETRHRNAKQRHDPEKLKRAKHDFKHGPGAFDLKAEKLREMEERQRARDAILSIAGEPTGITAEEMSRIFKDTAHGPGDSVTIPVTYGVAVTRPEHTGLAVFGDKGEKLVELGAVGGVGMHAGGLIGKPFPGAYISGVGTGESIAESLAKADELKRKQAADHEANELKRLTKAFVHGVGDEMSAALASAKDRGEGVEVASDMLKRLIIAASNNGLDIHELLEEVEMTEEEKSKEALALEALAKAITEYWTGPDYELEQDQFSLTGAASLTILRNPSESHKSGYGKKGHIGGEEFTGQKAYLGKRGQIICCFKPCGVEDYATMEMALGDCFAQLTGFQRHFVENGFNVQYQAIRDAKNEEKKAADLEQFSSKYEDFGSF